MLSDSMYVREATTPDTTLIMPIDLKLDAGQALIVFDTGMGSQIPLKAKLKNEGTDMIRLFIGSYGYTEGYRYLLE
jgi:hypothetical protein